ncbi:MAG: hypothetical protein AB7O97_20690 [Planctomycetota bacterium]
MSRSSTSSSEPRPFDGTAPDPAGTGDRVVGRSTLLVSTPLRRAVQWVALVAAGTLVVGTLLLDVLWPLPAPKLFGAEARREERQRLEAHFADGSLARVFADDWRKTSRVRRRALAAYVPLLYRVFGEVRAHQLAGRDGFLFLKDRLRAGLEGEPEATLAPTAARLRALSRALVRGRSRLVVAPIPRKAAMMADRLPPGVDVGVRYDEQVVPVFRAAGVDTVDLWSAMRAEPEPVFATADSHWNAVGMFAAARAVAAHLIGAANVCEVPILRSEDDLRRSLANALGLEPTAVEWLPPTVEPVFVLQNRAQAVVGPAPLPGFPLPPLLVGTSFSANSDGTSSMFGTALSAYLGLPLWNGARAGQTPTWALTQALRHLPDDALPPVVVMEIPDHFLVWSSQSLSNVGDTFAQLPAVGLVPLPERASGDGLERFAIPRAQRSAGFTGSGPTELTAPRMLRVPWERFVFPGDGTVAVRLTGRISQGSVQVVTGNGSDALASLWDGRRATIAVPLCGAGFVRRADVTLLRPGHVGRAVLDLESLELCSDLDPSGPRLPLAPARFDDAGWQQTATVVGVELGRDDCVGIALPGDDVLHDCIVTAGLDDGTEAVLFGPDVVRGDATLLLPVRAAAGRTVREVRISLSGPRGTATMAVHALPRLPLSRR